MLLKSMNKFGINSWLERTPDKREVDGSSPFRPTIPFLNPGALAQLGERLPCTQEVSGSIPLGSTKVYYLFFENWIKRH